MSHCIIFLFLVQLLFSCGHVHLARSVAFFFFFFRCKYFTLVLYPIFLTYFSEACIYLTLTFLVLIAGQKNSIFEPEQLTSVGSALTTLVWRRLSAHPYVPGPDSVPAILYSPCQYSPGGSLLYILNSVCRLSPSWSLYSDTGISAGWVAVVIYEASYARQRALILSDVLPFLRH